jgi:chorismate-pyruvate lyase
MPMFHRSSFNSRDPQKVAQVPAMLRGAIQAADEPCAKLCTAFPCPDGMITPAQALDALDEALLLRDSATQALEEWCGAHGVSPNPQVVAELLHAGRALLPPERRKRLGIGSAEPVHLRRVRLSCSGIVLSKASNWYVPSRLTAAMRQRLERTDAPFGRVVHALRFRRFRFSTERLWDPAMGGEVPAHVLRHHALLVDADGVPFSEVEETYTRDALFLVDRFQ